MVMIKSLILLSIALALHLVYADEGTATFYAPPYNPSACFEDVDMGVNIAGASEEIWENGGACGRMYNVTCTGPTDDNLVQPCKLGQSVTVKIVDECSKCDGTINLSQDAFQKISNTEAGKIKINYQRL